MCKQTSLANQDHATSSAANQKTHNHSQATGAIKDPQPTNRQSSSIANQKTYNRSQQKSPANQETIILGVANLETYNRRHQKSPANQPQAAKIKLGDSQEYN
jgi:hypothetical protein